MAIFSKPKPVGSTAFSRFFRYASSAEKKKVYEEVLRKASERQDAVMAEMAAKADNSPD